MAPMKHKLRNSQADKYTSDSKNTFCYQLFTILKLSMDSVNLCKDFVSFFTLLNTEYSGAAITGVSNKYPEFLNFWLNRQFRARSISVTPKSTFYQHLINNYKTFEAENKLNNKIHDIDDLHFNKLNSLYEFYKVYYDLKSNNNENCSKFLEHFKKDYTPAWKKCFNENDVEFCKALEKFTKFYEEDKTSISTVCITGKSSLPKLLSPRSYQIENKEDKKIGNSLIMGTHNATISGLSKINDKEYSQLHELISLRYNFLAVYNEDEKRSNMLKILQEFFQYCSRNRENSNLFSFFKEFLREYYIKNKSEYGEIYDDCSTSSESIKSYCSIYQGFSEQLRKSLLSINEIEEEDTEDETKIRQSFISYFSSDSIILQLEKDNNLLSNITPILVGTIAGGLLILFFLYKFSSFGSCLHAKILKNEETLYNFNEEIDRDLFENNSELEINNSNNRKIHLSYNPSLKPF
ncbi:PIR protein [Plasmodium ovale]|uniref:PIR protein n=1 Tax=Plasmodium ovale TaxID=36330 RepID=A0A1D3JCW4_PLAOA|nr:PIR protein [Plasmodium ovale]